jgi:hypothetical protein
VTSGELALFAFTACNTLRVVAYVPQLLKIARDTGGASAISYSTWGLFGVSHLSTVVYALAALGDWRLAFIFTANAAACGAILALTFYKRLRFAHHAVEAGEPCTRAVRSAFAWRSQETSTASREHEDDDSKVAIFPAERRRIAGGS